MKFSLKWLQQMIDLHDVQFTTLSNKLIISGFEIDNVIYNQYNNDITFDLTTTSNRQDILSVIGLAREISSILNRSLKQNLYKSSFINDFKPLNILSGTFLLDFSLIYINHINNNSSPLWLQHYLSSQGIKPINILIDIPQYIYLKWGHYIEIFDKNKITSSSIKYSLFNFKVVYYDLHMLNAVQLEVLKYDDLLLSTIGLSINANFNCDILTNTVLLFGRVYNKKYLKNLQQVLSSGTNLSQKSLNCGLRSDFFNAFYETVFLVRSLAFGVSGRLYGCYDLYDIRKTIRLKKSTIQNVLGSVRKGLYSYLTVKEVISLLERLYFVISYDNLKNYFTIQVPIHRKRDITRPIDIIEEIGRIYGFNNFISKLLVVSNKDTLINNIFINVYQIRYLLRYLGLNEVYNSSFDNFYINNVIKKNLSIFNPLIQDQSFLRSTLIVPLIANQQYNFRQGNKNIEIFEIGKVFKFNRKAVQLGGVDFQASELLCLSGLISNFSFLRQSWSHQPYSLTWFHAKGIIEDFLERLQVVVVWKKVNTFEDSSLFCHLSNLLNVNRTAIIYNVYNQEIGIFGQLCNISNSDTDTYVFEFHLIQLINSISSSNHINSFIKPYSIYPSIIRDLSLTLKSHHNINLLKQEILNFKNNLIESIEVFNHYKNNVKNGYYNVGLRITYRAYDRTLNQHDIISIDKQIITLLNRYKVDDMNIK
uniref:phenylalanine--tRNA ligase n=1 Tax=Hydropuntia rangiferina TaxID=338881 RepID=A0A345U8M1_9FLOR|nr:phenylalanine-tRNA ligase beta subunit [Hydropuntia rangiferina]AXI96807.1 phenylalanine-tRNA ligase beta subunit [Hydropuntia rangiferina]UAD87487.1 phenylalanine-tRNA ligase beta subunit [Hydropuntia rangiferina]